MQKSITANAMWNVMARVGPLVITFFLTPFLIKTLGISHYGLYMLIMSVSGLMGIMSFGLGDATIRYVAYYHNLKDMEGVNRVFGSTLLVYLIIGFFTIPSVIVLAPKIIALFAVSAGEKDLATQLLRLSAVGFFLSLLNGVINAIPQALQRYDINTRIVVSMAILQAIFTVILLLNGYGIIFLVFLGLSVQGLTVFINYFVARGLLPRLKVIPSFSRDGLQEVFGFGIFSFLSQVFGVGFGYSDRLLTGAFISSGSVGFLTVPQDLAFRALSIVEQTSAVLFPRFSVINDPKERARLYLNASWAMLFISSLIFVPLTIFMPDFISLWINPEFASKCSHLGQLIAASSIVRGAFVTYQSLFKGINKPQYITILSCLVGITSLLLNLLLIPRYGLAGAGYSYCCTALLGVITVYLTWRFVLRERDIFPLVRALLLPALLAFACMYLVLNIKFLYPPIGWTSLTVEVVLTISMTASVLYITDRITGGNESGAMLLQRGVMNTLKLRLQTDRGYSLMGK